MTSRPSITPLATTSSPGGLVASIDHLASSAGAQLLAAGGSAADAAIAANAVLAVTAPHMCGIGGDLFALVHDRAGAPRVLDAAGRAGSGADPDRLRREGHTSVPLRGDVAAAPVPGCVDGWLALHEQYGRRPLQEVLAPAIRLGVDGFPVSPLLAFMLHTLDGLDGCDELALPRPDVGERMRRPAVAATLSAIAQGGRAAFYGGDFGRGLVELGHGEYVAEDLEVLHARWIEPLGVEVWGHHVWTPPPTSQGYLTLLAATIAEQCGLARGSGPEPGSPEWAHLMVEAAHLAAHDRPSVLHDAAPVERLLERDEVAERSRRFDPDHVTPLRAPTADGGTMHLCAIDTDGTGVSLIQSNAKDFGCLLAVPGTGVLLHNRGLGFNLRPGHPAEYGPRRRPPHTLAPALFTRPDGTLRALVGTMGGDSQPQIVLQLAARLLAGSCTPGEAVVAPRLVLAADPARGGSGFDTWTDPDDQVLRVEGHAPPGWVDGLAARGHRVEVAGFDPAGFGHAHVIEVDSHGMRHGATDPRAMTGAAIAVI